MKPPETVRNPPGVVTLELPRVSECRDSVLERVAADRDRVEPVADPEARGVVDVDAEGIEHIAALVPDTARDVVAGTAGAAKRRTGRGVVIGLGLVVVGAVTVDRGVPVEPVVIGLRIFPGQRPRGVLGIGCIHRRSPVQRDQCRRRRRPAILLPDVVLIILEHDAGLDFVAFGRPYRQLHQPAGDLVAGVADLGALAVFIIALGAVHRAAEDIDIGIGAHAAEDRAEATGVVGAIGAGQIDAPALARAHHVVDVLGAERDHTADGAGAVDVRGRAAHHVDAADQFGIEKERAVAVVAGALVVLPRAVDDDGNAAEILQAANVDHGRRIVAALLERDAGHVVENIRQPVRLQPLDLFERDDADRRQRVDRALLGLRGRHRNGVERLHRGAADLRPRVHHRRRRLLFLLGLRGLAFCLFLLLRLANRAGVRRLRETGVSDQHCQ